jgi:hypothetical protein
MGLTAPLVDRPLLANVASGTSPGVDVAGCANLTFYAVGGAGVSAGAVTIEESHDKDFAGTWTPLATAITFIVGVAAPLRIAGTAKAVRARITTPVTGGTASVYLVGR